MQYQLELRGIDEAADRLEDTGDRAAHARAAMDKIVDALIEGEQSLWRRNGGGGKKKWAPNTKSTLASKIAKGLDPRPMRATGALERSLTVKHAPNQLLKIDNNSMEFGTKLFYAQFSQLAKNPARRRIVLDIAAKQKRTIREIILDHIVHGS